MYKVATVEEHQPESFSGKTDPMCSKNQTTRVLLNFALKMPT